MKTLKILTTVLAITILASCSYKNTRTVDNILNSSFRVYQISGYQGPKIDIKKDSLAQFLTALHYRIPLSEIESALKWSSETTERNINALIKNILLTKKGDYYQPTLGIFTLERGSTIGFIRKQPIISLQEIIFKNRKTKCFIISFGRILNQIYRQVR